MLLQRRVSDVAPFGEFRVLKADGAFLFTSQSSAVEDEEEFVAFVLGGCPVHDQHWADWCREAEFFFDFAHARRTRRLTRLYVAAGDVPVVLVAGAYEEYVAFVVEEEGACGDAWGCRGWHFVGRHQGSVDGLGSVEHLESAGEADQFGGGFAALPAYPGEGELAAEEVVADLFGCHLFGVEQGGLGVVDSVP